MVKIVIENLGKKVLEVNDTTKSILAHFHEARLDWMQACGGKGRCTTCKFRIVSGEEHLSPLTKPETNYRKERLLSHRERLACQVATSGDIVIYVPREVRLPHMHYQD